MKKKFDIRKFAILDSKGKDITFKIKGEVSVEGKIFYVIKDNKKIDFIPLDDVIFAYQGKYKKRKGGQEC